jgi:hypothetical protein
MLDLSPITDALRAAQQRGALPTALDTAGLRELGAEVLARSVFTANGTNVVFADELKKLIDRLAAGDMGEGQVRSALWELLDVLGYDAEKGGFPGEELEPALKGTLQDLKSFRRLDLIVRTQQDLMSGAGQAMRGQTPDRLATFPAWELVRVLGRMVPRDWPSRWAIAGGKLSAGGRMIALKGDPVWGELGSYDNFQDALGVDHPPFAFQSGMGWKEISAAECRKLGITGPAGEAPDEWLATRPATLAGRQPLPTPKISLKGVDPDLISQFKKATKAMEDPKKPGTFDFDASAERSNAWRDQARAQRAEQEKADALASYPKGVPTR